MKRNTAFLIEKRDGRKEWLRATKLARSIQCALGSGADPVRVGGAGDLPIADTLELVTMVLRDVSARRRARIGSTSGGDGAALVTSAELAAAVARVLFASGHSRAAARFVAARSARECRPDRVALEPRFAAVATPRTAHAGFLRSPNQHERN